MEETGYLWRRLDICGGEWRRLDICGEECSAIPLRMNFYYRISYLLDFSVTACMST